MEDQRRRARASGGRDRGTRGELRERRSAFSGASRVRDRLRRLRDDRQRDDRRRASTAERRAGAGQARRVAVLRHRRRPGRRRRATSSAPSGDCRARVEDVLRLGDDQVVALVAERGELKPGERVHAHVDRAARHATECNHTATHLLHAALRRAARRPRAPGRLLRRARQAALRLHPRQRADARGAAPTSRTRSTPGSWPSDPVHAITTTLDEAKRLGATALFGEKYGEVVRMVEVGDGSFSRELCGGTHVRDTAEIGLFKLVTETSSAANVRRIEALTGPAAVELLRAPRPHAVRGRASRCGSRPSASPTRSPSSRRAAASSSAPSAAAPRGNGAVDVEALLGAAAEIDGAHVLTAALAGVDGKALLDVADRLQGQARRRRDRARQRRRGPRRPGRERRAGARRSAACARARSSRPPRRVVGGGGGGRDTLARAGGRDAAKLPGRDRGRPRRRSRTRPDTASVMRVLALDYGSARCGCAVSDPTGVLATPIDPVLSPAHPQGHRRGCASSSRELEVDRVVVGLPLSLSGADTAQTTETRAFAERLGERLAGPGRALRRALHDAAGRAHRRAGQRGLARRRTSARELAGRARRPGSPRVSDSSERSAEEREAARRERERRRAGRSRSGGRRAGRAAEPAPRPPSRRARPSPWSGAAGTTASNTRTGTRGTTTTSSTSPTSQRPRRTTRGTGRDPDCRAGRAAARGRAGGRSPGRRPAKRPAGGGARGSGGCSPCSPSRW